MIRSTLTNFEKKNFPSVEKNLFQMFDLMSRSAHLELQVFINLKKKNQSILRNEKTMSLFLIENQFS